VYSPPPSRAGDEPPRDTKEAIGAPGGAGAPAAGQGYTIKCPEGWTVRKGMIPQIDLTLSCDADPGVTISVTRAPAGAEKEITESAAREMKEMLTANFPGYEVTAEEWRAVDAARAYRVSARYTLKAGELQMAMQNSQVLFVKGGTVYTITYTSTPGLFMKHLGEFETTLESFGARIEAIPTAPGQQPAARTAAPPASRKS
jgi:hypothetical protein